MNQRYLRYKESKAIYDNKSKAFDSSISELQKEIDFYDAEYRRIDHNLNNAESIIHNLSLDFRNKTSLSQMDYSFIFFAVSLHCIRYIFQPKIDPSFNKISASDRHSSAADGSMEFKLGKQELEQFNDIKKSHKYPNSHEIFLRPVPYDAMKGTENIFIPGVTDKGKNLYSYNHHSATMGHDPVLGYFFGTMNILTSTITFKTITLDSNIVRHVRGLPKEQYVDISIGFPNVISKSIESISEDPNRLKAAVVRQFLHMQSDKFTKTGLPIPFVSASTAQELLEQGWNSYELERLLKHLANNFVTIGMQSALCILINAIIEILYKLANTTDRDAIREVKSRKIVDYSNVIASCSNIVYSMVTQDLSKLDIGGFIVTVYRICTDSKIIEQIRDEFVYGSYEQQLILNEYRREDKV